jgi:hypothetical protein
MKKEPTDTEPTMRDHYDFTKSKLVRGKYYEDYQRHQRVVVLDPDVAELYPDSKTVNDALRELAKSRGASD